MKKINPLQFPGISFLLIVLTALATASSDGNQGDQKTSCTPESAKNTPGKWSVDVYHSAVSSPALPSMVKNLELEAELIRKALGEPVGFDARCYFSVPGDPFTKKSPHPMEVNVPFYSYYCYDGKLEIDDEYDSGVMVHANSTWPMGDLRGVKLGAKTFRMLGSPIGTIRGYPAFEADWRSIASGASFTWVVLVPKKGMSPFRYATRAEILDHLVQIVNKNREENLALIDQTYPIRPAEVQNAEKQMEYSSFISGAKDEAQRKKWIDRFNNDYRTDQQKREEGRQKSLAHSDKVVARLEAVRARYTSEQLKETGYVFPWLLNYNTEYNEDDFDFAQPKNDPNCRPADMTNCPDMGKPLAIFAAGYLNPDLPSTSPQYFTVAFSWTATKADNFRNAKYEKLRDEFFARFDFDQLVTLLGK